MSKHHTDLLVTGGSGLLGSALKKIQPNATYISSKQYDLTSAKQTEKMFLVHRPKQVVHLAAKVGGVKANNDYVADFCTDNMLINTHVLKYAHKYDVEKMVSVLSTCVYPDVVEYPLTEDKIQNGEPNPTNFGYAYAKRMLDVMSRAYRKQYGCNFVTVIPNNLFGYPNDNFDLENSHVIPALIHKFHQAKLSGADKVVLWGSGHPLREFSFTDDIARAIMFVMDKYDGANPINIGNTNEISIKELADKIAAHIGFNGKIEWDTTKPNGQFRKPSDNSRLNDLGWFNADYTDFDAALKETIDWFKENYPDARGVRIEMWK